MCVANCQASDGKRSLFSFAEIIAIITIGAIGVVFFLAFWGIWYWINDSIPTFLGHSRLLLDAIAGFFWAIGISVYLVDVSDKCDIISCREESYGTLREFASTYPWTLPIGIALFLGIVASIFVSFATIPVIYAAGVVVYYAFKAIRSAICFLIFICTMFKFTKEKPPETGETN